MARLQFELSNERLGELEALMKRCGFKTKKDLFNNALTFFEWALNERATGRIIASVDEANSKYKELVMVAIEAASK